MVKKPILIALYGPAGMGKTAVAGKLCRKLPGRTARISVDVLRDMVCMHCTTGRQSDRYITLSKELVLPMVRDLLKKGYNVVVEVAPPTNEDKGATDKRLARTLSKMGGHVFLLTAPLDVVVKRNKHRSGEFGQGNLTKKLTEQLYRYCEKYLDPNDFHVIDTARVGADKTTSLILEAL
jgi:adenylylsulfate kinase-like enzyme